MGKEQDEQSGEDRLIARYFKPLARDPGAFDLTDDAAAIAPPPDCDIVLSTDGVVGGVHFFADDPPEAIAKKALRVNLSDLAAKGAQPLGFLLTLAVSEEIDDAWLAPFAHSLGADADLFRCPLLGGDTVSTTGPTTISVTVLGFVEHGRMVRRSGASAGDRILVTGTIGDAALGVKLRRNPALATGWGIDARQRQWLQSRYLVPQPRTALAGLVAEYASAAMDVSDGLVGDLAKLCRASAVAGEIRAAQVPLSDAARAALDCDRNLAEVILGGGDDYEILATVSVAALASFRRKAAEAEVSVTEIGTIECGEGSVRIVGFDGMPLQLAHASYSHF